MSKKKVYWPSWRYGPNGEAAIFNSHEEVPVGWFESRADAEAHAVANVTPPENGADYWEGYSKTFLIQMLRKAGERVHANISARKAFEKCEYLGILDGGEDEDAAEEGIEQEGDLG